MSAESNHPAAGKADIASWFAFGHRWSGLPEPVRSTTAHAMHRALSLTFVVLLASTVFCLSADTNAPAFRFHPELAGMSTRIATPIVLTNSPLLGLPTLQVSNHFSKAGFYWKTTGVALVDTGYKKFPQHSDYVWSRRFILTFARDKVTTVEVCDQPTDCVIMQERKS